MIQCSGLLYLKPRDNSINNKVNRSYINNRNKEQPENPINEEPWEDYHVDLEAEFKAEKEHWAARETYCVFQTTMNRIAEENSARRIQSFDTVLPDQARVEFTRRPRALAKLQPPDGNILWLAGAIVFGAIILAATIGLTGRHQAQQLVPDRSAVPGVLVRHPAATGEPTSAVTPTQPAVAALTPALRPTPGSRPEFAVAPYAPRAELVRLPPPRAQLMRLPEWRIGEERPVMMPYGLQVAARLRGNVPSTNRLPMSGNAIGDTWVIGDSVWVWVTAPGASSASWVDP
jgi:hypothetical protein